MAKFNSFSSHLESDLQSTLLSKNCCQTFRFKNQRKYLFHIIFFLRQEKQKVCSLQQNTYKFTSKQQGLLVGSWIIWKTKAMTIWYHNILLVDRKSN